MSRDEQTQTSIDQQDDILCAAVKTTRGFRQTETGSSQVGDRIVPQMMIEKRVDRGMPQDHICMHESNPQQPEQKTSERVNGSDADAASPAAHGR